MGTNYYTIDKKGNKIHIGKRSYGYRFFWDFQGIQTSYEFLSFLSDKNIIDEYSQEIDKQEFMNMAHNWFIKDGKIPSEETRIIDNVWVVCNYINFN